MDIVGTPLQALKFAELLSPDDCQQFIHDWMHGDAVEYVTFYEPSLGDDVQDPAGTSFVAFCAANPDEPTITASDGTERQKHYGDGRQPWDDIRDLGWGPEFCAGNALKYVRRDHTIKKRGPRA